MAFRLSPLNYLTTSVAVFCLSAATPASAQAPKQLYNKSILVNLTTSIPARGSDGSTPGPRTTSRIVYVSSAGRVFVKTSRVTRRNQTSDAKGPDDRGGNLAFNGNRLVGTVQAASGAINLSVTFDPSFQSCSTSVIYGRDGSKPFTWKGLDGITYTSTGAPTSTTSCSIREGNALAE